MRWKLVACGYEGGFYGWSVCFAHAFGSGEPTFIVVEAFIYSPDKLKRNLMRQMEASLYTLRVPGDKQTGAEIPLGVTKEQSKATDQGK